MKLLIQNPYSTDNICQVKCYFPELRSEYDNLKDCFRQGLDLINSKADAAEIKKQEDAISNHFEGVKKNVLSAITKATSYITEFGNVPVRESWRNSTLNASATSHPIVEPNVKLPQIDIPKLNGKIENFLEFSALFENVIHEEATISKVKKLYYLKNALTSSARSLIRDVPLNDQGYDEAWALVLSSYRNMKIIIWKRDKQSISY